jgi:hypothetical protein
VDAGQVAPVIDRTYPLSQAAEAISYLQAGHGRGKVIITVWMPGDHTQALTDSSAIAGLVLRAGWMRT